MSETHRRGRQEGVGEVLGARHAPLLHDVRHCVPQRGVPGCEASEARVSCVGFRSLEPFANHRRWDLVTAIFFLAFFELGESFEGFARLQKTTADGAS